MKNPYPQTITDEASGLKVSSEKHRIWQEGYKACQDRMIQLIGRDEIAKKYPHFFD